MILIDTSVWSLGLRRRRRDLNQQELSIFYTWESLLKRGEAAIIGPICQEVLAGIAVPEIFNHIRLRLLLMEELPVTIETFIRAAEFYNICRSAGVAPGPVDMTICAAADIHGVPIFSVDPDFALYARHLPVSLFHL